LCYRLSPVSVKIGGNRRLPIGKEIPGSSSPYAAMQTSILFLYEKESNTRTSASAKDFIL